MTPINTRMKPKTFDEFLAENSGGYCYYGPGSLLPIVSKLSEEGKTPDFVYHYLTVLGIDEERKRKAISAVYGGDVMESIQSVFSGMIFEDEIDDLLSDEAEDEVSKKKSGDGKEEDGEEDGKEDGAEDEEKPDGEKEGEDEDTQESDQTVLLKKVLKDQGKLDRIRAILKEALGVEIGEEADPEQILAAEMSAGTADAK